jgi:hypothetical protein
VVDKTEDEEDLDNISTKENSNESLKEEEDEVPQPQT